MRRKKNHKCHKCAVASNTVENKYVFKWALKVVSDSPVSRRLNGSSFHARGLAFAKDRSQKVSFFSQKIPPLNFSDIFFQNGWTFLVQILHVYCTFLSTLDYKFLFNYLQIWRSYAILSATIIICSKCPPSVEMHAGCSHLMWHNFVTVGDN